MNKPIKKMRDGIAATTSVIFSPFLVPIATILIIVQTYAFATGQAFLWSAIVTLFVSMLPMLYIFILFRLGQVSDLHLAVREQRMLPLFFAMMSALVGTAVLYLLDAPREIVWAVVAYVVNGVVFTAITQHWKISFHSGVTAGCITVLILLVDARFSGLFVLLPLIAWARVHRKRHTLLQTVVGAVVSVFSTVTVLQPFL
jgi:hypothetical protein